MRRVDVAIKSADKNTVKSGPGIRRRVTPTGTTLSMLGRTFGWDHPFAVHYYGTKSEIAPGMINADYPKIKGKSIKPDSKGVFPLLDMQLFKGAASWVVVEIERGGTGTVAGDRNKPLIKSMTVKHVQQLNDQEINAFFGGALAYPDLPGNKTRLPLARIEAQQFGPAIFQVAYFNYSYTIKIVNGKTHNYFYPA